MKTGTKALNTDVLKVMKNIVSSHVEHYQSDFELDIEALKEAAGKKERTERIFVWMCRTSGTWLLREKDVFIKGTRENNTFCFYKEQTRDDVLCYVIEANSLDSDTVRGNFYAFDYETYFEHVKTTAVQAESVILQYEHGKRTIPPTQHFGSYPDYELGEFVSYKFVPESAEQLEMVLINEKRIRERFKEDYQIIGYELYEYPKSPTENGRYYGKAPLLEQAETILKEAKENGLQLFIKAVCSGGKARYL